LRRLIDSCSRTRSHRAQGKRFVVLDFKRPSGWLMNRAAPLLAKLLTGPFGGTIEMASRKPWLSLEKYLAPIQFTSLYMGGAYIATVEKDGLTAASGWSDDRDRLNSCAGPLSRPEGQGALSTRLFCNVCGRPIDLDQSGILRRNVRNCSDIQRDSTNTVLDPIRHWPFVGLQRRPAGFGFGS
jgi:hypothetical protein